MSEKTLNARIQMKTDTEANWLNKTDFVPKTGEIIIYAIDATHSYQRIKVGDGTKKVNELPFINVADSELSSTSTNAIQNKAVANMKTNIEDQLDDKPSKTGEGASGTWDISITGSAYVSGSAVSDAKGQQIASTYIKGLSINGKTITYTKGDGTTGTITTQDTDTTYDNMTGATSTAAGAAGLVPAPAAGANLKYLRGDGTWQDVSTITNAEIDEICNATIYDQSEVQV